MSDCGLTFIDHSPAIDVVLPAFMRALAEVADVAATEVADTGSFAYRYAPLVVVLHAIKQALANEGLVSWQVPHSDPDAGMVYVTTSIGHDGGEAGTPQWLTFAPLGLRLGQTSQATGSAISYARRYALTTLFNITVADDDGAASSSPGDLAGSPHRTHEEARIHELFAEHPPAVGVEVRRAFRVKFGQGLSTLPIGRHDEALTFVEGELARLTETTDHDHDHEGY